MPHKAKKKLNGAPNAKLHPLAKKIAPDAKFQKSIPDAEPFANPDATSLSSQSSLPIGLGSQSSLPRSSQLMIATSMDLGSQSSLPRSSQFNVATSLSSQSSLPLRSQSSPPALCDHSSSLGRLVVECQDSLTSLPLDSQFRLPLH